MLAERDFESLLTRCLGNVHILAEDRGDLVFLLCYASISAPLSLSLDNKWSSVADFVHPGRAFVINKYSSDTSSEEIKQDFDRFAALLAKFIAKKGVKNE